MIILAQHKQGFKLPKRTENITIYHIDKLSNLQKLITAIEIGSITENLIILSEDLEWLQNNFLKSFKIIVAGGGLVTNSAGKVLMMFRKKKWDLPKGKIEKGESIKDGAVREIEEETGVKVLAIQRKLGKTYHTYKLKDKWVLKETHWFLMNGDDTSALVPETKEDIEKVEWCTKKEIKEYLKNSYVSIQDVFDFKKQL